MTDNFSEIIKKLESQQANASNPETKEAISLLVRELYGIAADISQLQTDPKGVVKRRKPKGLFNL